MMQNDWKAIGLTIIVLFAFGMVNDKTNKIATWIAAILALTIFLKKWKGG